MLAQNIHILYHIEPNGCIFFTVGVGSCFEQSCFEQELLFTAVFGPEKKERLSLKRIRLKEEMELDGK